MADQEEKIEQSVAFAIMAIGNIGISIICLTACLLVIETNASSLFDYIFWLITWILIDFWLGYRIFLQHLKLVIYSYGNLHLFRKYTFLHEALCAVAIAFLLGVLPAIFDYMHYENELVIFRTNVATIWISCNAAGTKCILEYLRTIWDTENRKSGKSLKG